MTTVKLFSIAWLSRCSLSTLPAKPWRCHDMPDHGKACVIAYMHVLDGRPATDALPGAMHWSKVRPASSQSFSSSSLSISLTLVLQEQRHLILSKAYGATTQNRYTTLSLAPVLNPWQHLESFVVFMLCGSVQQSCVCTCSTYLVSARSWLWLTEGTACDSLRA